MKSSILPSLTLILTLMCAIACDNGTDAPAPMTIRITNPPDSIALPPDSTVRIMTEVTSPCGCSMHTEFYIDGEHRYSDYLPYYTFDWTAPTEPGWHTISARAVKDDNTNEAWDSIHVRVTDMIVPGRTAGIR